MSNRPDAFMPLWIGDYLKDTAHLTVDQHGAYLLLLMAYWCRGSALPADDQYLARVARVTPQKWRSIRQTIAAFFDERDGVWRSDRADKELAKAQTGYERRAAAGRLGAEAKKAKAPRARYSAPLCGSSRTPEPAFEAEQVFLADSSQSDSSNATGNAQASVQQSQSHIRTRTDVSSPTTLSSHPEIQSLGDSLLVHAEREPLPRPASKAILSKAQRGTRWPADAVVPDDWIRAGAERRRAHGKPPIDLVLEAEKFRNYWAAKSGAAATKIDWRLTWNTWALNSNGANGNGKGQFGRSVIDDNPQGNFAAIAARLRADRESRETFDA